MIPGGQISAPNNTLGLIALPPAPERPLRHAQDLRGLGLAQITPITASVDILELHQSQSLQLLRLSDEINDRHYLIVDALDGRTHYVDIGKGEATEPTPEGAIVRIDPKHPEPRPVDRTASEIAAANGGRYDVDIHLRHDPSASASFAETHVRRLEAIRRVTGGVKREPDGTWVIAPDHLERAAAFERRKAQASPVVVQTLSSLPLERQVGAEGATWLDHELVAEIRNPSATRVSAGRCARRRRCGGNG